MTAAARPQDESDDAAPCTPETCPTAGWMALRAFWIGVACGAGGVLFLNAMREIERLIR